MITGWNNYEDSFLLLPFHSYISAEHLRENLGNLTIIMAQETNVIEVRDRIKKQADED